MKILVILGLLLRFSLELEAAPSSYEILSRWAVELGHAKNETALDRYQRAKLSGLTLDDGYFYSTSFEGRLEKRSLLTGETVWRSPLGADLQSTWALDAKDAKLFGGDTKGNLYSIDSKTGNILWKTASKGVFFAKPLIGADQIWAMNSRGTLSSYDKDSGQWLWQQNDPDSKNLLLWSFQGPVLFNNSVVSGFPSGVLQGFDPKSGKALWNESFNILAQGAESFNDLKSIQAASDYLFASSFSGDLKAWVSMKGGKSLLWSKKISLHAPMQIGDDGILYFSARDGSVQAVEIKTGYLKWQFDLPEGLGTEPAVGDRYVWVASTKGFVYVLSKADGKIVNKTGNYQATIWNPTVLVPQDDSQALVITETGIIRKLHLAKVR